MFGHRVTTRGCFYHLTQATWRIIQNLGLFPTYNADKDLHLFCGMLDGLAFLPVEDVAEGMQYLRDNVPEDPPEAVELLDYFDKNVCHQTIQTCPSTSSMSPDNTDLPIHQLKTMVLFNHSSCAESRPSSLHLSAMCMMPSPAPLPSTCLECA